jgi:hypothetical protein
VSNFADFVTLADATAALSASLPAGALATLPQAITRASKALQRYTQRDIVLSTYDECYDGAGSNTLILRQYPVVGPVTLATTPTTVLTVWNGDPVTNQQASASLTTTGDTVTGLVVSGLTLTRTASGVSTADASTVFATYRTLRSAADHVNTLGNGWHAAAAAGYDLWPTADLRAVQGSGNAANGAAATFLLHANVLSGFTVNERSGLVTLGAGSSDPAFAVQGFGAGSFPQGSQNVRARYAAGYATVPEDLQQACLLTIQAWATALKTSQQFKSESAKSYSYTLADKQFGLPEGAVAIIRSGGWKAYRRY